jgi:hypothetical protein
MRAGRLFVSVFVIAGSLDLVSFAARPQGNPPQVPPGQEKKGIARASTDRPRPIQARARIGPSGTTARVRRARAGPHGPEQAGRQRKRQL